MAGLFCCPIQQMLYAVMVFSKKLVQWFIHLVLYGYAPVKRWVCTCFIYCKFIHFYAGNSSADFFSQRLETGGSAHFDKSFIKSKKEKEIVNSIRNRFTEPPKNYYL